MNGRRVSSLARTSLRQMVREPATLFLIILFPVVLTLTFGVLFGGIGGASSTVYQIGIVADPNPPRQCSQEFLESLSATEILILQDYPDNQTAQADLLQGNIQAILIIPDDFDESCISFLNSPDNPGLWVNSTVQMYLDSGSIFATQAIPPIIQQVLSGITSVTQPNASPSPIILSRPSLVEASELGAFDFMAPGIFAFATIFFTMTVAQSFTSDREKGLLKRISVTPTTPTEFMMGHTISHLLAAILQVALVFTMAFLVGYRPLGGAISLVFAFVIVTVFSLTTVGFGLITATIAKSSGAATGISFIFIMPQMFLGTFVSAGFSGTAQTVGQFVPSYYVTDALTTLFLRGAPVSSPTVLFDLGVLSIVSVVVLLVGIFLFGRYGTR